MHMTTLLFVLFNDKRLTMLDVFIFLFEGSIVSEFLMLLVITLIFLIVVKCF